MKRLYAACLSTALALAMSVGLFIPVSTVTAASCGGSAASCDGTSPQATGCAADAVTRATAALKDDANVTRGQIQLRYSPSCRTAWSRVVNWSVSANITYIIASSAGQSETDSDQLAKNQSGYSPQIYVAGRSAQAGGLWNLHLGFRYTAWVAF